MFVSYKKMIFSSVTINFSLTITCFGFPLGHRVENMENITTNKFIPNQIVSTEIGIKIQTDMVIRCTGSYLNTQFLTTSMGRLFVMKYYN